ncbi:MAG: reverse transcriptase/maturase family protein [Clostridia bacterium]
MGSKFNDIFKSKISYSLLYDSYLLSKKGKRYRDDVIKFGLRFEDYLNSILNDLKSNKYVFSKYKLFYVYEPKCRKVLAASFRDRIVHTWYVKSFIEPIFVPTFINNSYACIIGKGMHKCMRDVRRSLCNVSRDDRYINGYILKMDIAKYFQNIDRNILFDIIQKKVYDKDFLLFTKSILNSSSMYDEVEGVSIPIGNYSSQMFANIYLNEVDQFVKHKLGCRYYFRYMDDSLCICKSKEEAKYFLNEIIVFLNDKLHLKLNKKTSIFKISQGVNFCGYKINKDYVKIRVTGRKKLIKKIKYIRYKITNNLIDFKDVSRLLCGHIGYIKYANIGNILNKYF